MFLVYYFSFFLGLSNFFGRNITITDATNEKADNSMKIKYWLKGNPSALLSFILLLTFCNDQVNNEPKTNGDIILPVVPKVIPRPFPNPSNFLSSVLLRINVDPRNETAIDNRTKNSITNKAIQKMVLSLSDWIKGRNGYNTTCTNSATINIFRAPIADNTFGINVNSKIKIMIVTTSKDSPIATVLNPYPLYSLEVAAYTGNISSNATALKHVNP